LEKNGAETQSLSSLSSQKIILDSVLLDFLPFSYLYLFNNSLRLAQKITNYWFVLLIMGLMHESFNER
jgi:hypothetical protein